MVRIAIPSAEIAIQLTRGPLDAPRPYYAWPLPYINYRILFCSTHYPTNFRNDNNLQALTAGDLWPMEKATYKLLK